MLGGADRTRSFPCGPVRYEFPGGGVNLRTTDPWCCFPALGFKRLAGAVFLQHRGEAASRTCPVELRKLSLPRAGIGKTRGNRPSC